jgi:hypothetical protein
MYSLEVKQLWRVSGGPTLTTRATISTQGTSIVVPPGLIYGGGFGSLVTYFFRLTAYQGGNRAQTPYHRPSPRPSPAPSRASWTRRRRRAGTHARIVSRWLQGRSQSSSQTPGMRS